MRCLLFAAFAAIAAAVMNANTKTVVRSTLSVNSADASYVDFLRRHGHRQGVQDSVSHAQRRKLYHARLATIEDHNSQKRSYKAVVNKFADFTDQELRGMLGYKRAARSSRGPSGAQSSSFLQLGATGEQIATPKKKIAAAVDWRQKLSSANFFRDQGSCGSCWAVAAVGALEMQAELSHGNTTELSYQQLVDCVQNPQHCGGTGGCSGATAELAFEYIQTYGLGSDGSYSGGGSMCKSTHPAVSIGGWNRLPVNEAEPLLEAVSNGPVVLSVDGSPWFSYDTGVFDGCQKDTIVNHAVLAVGYGKDAGKGYWLIRNSWGKGWGEEGHIRLLRHAVDEPYCGVDTNPKEGVGCDGGPEEIPICGMCGMLSDSSHPVGSVVKA